jgi:DNA-binding beta-propeller fold protein YncE
MGWVAATALATLITISCGQVYRPVVIPIATNPPNPQNFHAVFGISSNVSSNPGSVLQIDVSGDTNIGVANMGINPTHAAALPSNQRIFVASAGSLIPGDPDTITSFSPAASSTIATGIGGLTVFSLPNVGPNQSSAITSIIQAINSHVVTVTLSQPIGLAAVGGQIVISGVNIGAYNGNFAITAISGNTIQYNNPTAGLSATSGGTATIPIPTFCSYLPDFVTTTQNTAVYVANYGVEAGPNSTCAFASTDSVALLNPNTGAVENIAYLTPGGSGPAVHPVAMAETANAQNLYVVNQGDGVSPSTVMNLSPTDLSQLASPITVGINPTWVVARPDNQRVYVLTQGDGLLVPIDVATNTVLQSQTNLSVGAGANFLLYDSNLNRLYVTNPTTGNVFVYSATGGVDLGGNANDTPRLLATISMAGGACPGGCSPVSVTALPDGSRFYVASYRLESACTDSNVGATACIVPMLTVFDAPSNTVKTGGSPLLKGSPSLSLLASPPFSATQYAVPPVASCAPAPIYMPGTTRFRLFTTSSSDSSHVYVSICDAGAIAVVATTTNSINQGTNAPDTLVNNIAAPFGACSGANCAFAAPITSFAITGNVVTFQTTSNNFIAGEQVQIQGMSIGTYLNGQTLTVRSTPSSTQFSANFTHADVASTADSGSAIGLQVAQITSLSINSNVVTFQGINTFTAGTRVAISGLSSAAGSPLNGQTLTVIATGLSTKQFECVLSTPEGNAGSTTDAGVAVPQVPPQTPIFLVTGQ